MGFDPTRVQAIIFDVDGTLRDTDGEIIEQIATLLKPLRRWLPYRDPRRAARRIVMKLEDPAQLMLYIPDTLGIDRYIFAIVTRIRSLIWHSKTNHDYRVINGVTEVLEQLSQQYPLAVVSAGPKESSGAFLATTKLQPYFQVVATALTCRYTKPYPDPLWWVANQLGIAPERCVMIGDTTVDMRAGRAAATQTIGVLCGFGERAELVRDGADVILGSTAEVATLFAHQ